MFYHLEEVMTRRTLGPFWVCTFQIHLATWMCLCNSTQFPYDLSLIPLIYAKVLLTAVTILMPDSNISWPNWQPIFWLPLLSISSMCEEVHVLHVYINTPMMEKSQIALQALIECLIKKKKKDALLVN